VCMHASALHSSPCVPCPGVAACCTHTRAATHVGEFWGGGAGVCVVLLCADVGAAAVRPHVGHVPITCWHMQQGVWTVLLLCTAQVPWLKHAWPLYMVCAAGLWGVYCLLYLHTVCLECTAPWDQQGALCSVRVPAAACAPFCIVQSAAAVAAEHDIHSLSTRRGWTLFVQVYLSPWAVLVWGVCLHAALCCTRSCGC
jgi:hypothetical protein